MHSLADVWLAIDDCLFYGLKHNELRGFINMNSTRNRRLPILWIETSLSLINFLALSPAIDDCLFYGLKHW